MPPITPFSGTVTANAGTGTFANHDSSPATTPVSGTITANAGTGVFYTDNAPGQTVDIAGTVTANAGTGTFANNDSSPADTPVKNAAAPNDILSVHDSGSQTVSCVSGCSGGGGGAYNGPSSDQVETWAQWILYGIALMAGLVAVLWIMNLLLPTFFGRFET